MLWNKGYKESSDVITYTCTEQLTVYNNCAELFYRLLFYTLLNNNLAKAPSLNSLKQI